MTTPTPADLADALGDTARGYTLEILGATTPDPQLGTVLAARAKRVAARLRPDDPRLSSFAGFTDATGYFWPPQSARDYIADPDNRLWSFERWFTGLAEVCANTEPRAAEDLAELVEDAAVHERMMADHGMRLAEISQGEDRTYLLFKRPRP